MKNKKNKKNNTSSTIFEQISPGDLKQLLDTEAQRINSPAFIDADPVQFPRRYEQLPDIEIAALLSATIAWGNRTMICRDADRMLQMMENSPHSFVLSGDFEDLPDGNIHRTFFVRNLKYYLRGLQSIYKQFPTLADFARANHIASDPMPAWAFVRALNDRLIEANGGVADSRCLPQNLDNTALKRINMALRWLVRDDGIVDLGVWDNVLTPDRLFIPLDVHVGNIGRQLGLLQRRSNDRKAVVELTDALRRFNPADPVVYDYALFGIGIGL